MRTTYMAKPEEVEKKWYIIDADRKVLGRLAAEVASILKGKHKPQYTPHVDTGDYVIIINCEKVRLTGKKSSSKVYYSHSGYPGGLKTIEFRTLIKKHPEKVITKAVYGMLPKNKLGRKMMKKLKVYKGSEHPHEAQKPERWEKEPGNRKEVK